MRNSGRSGTSMRRGTGRRKELRPDRCRGFLMLYPLTFHPIFKERVWGNRKLEQLYHKALPPDAPIGESWEISDRPGDVSVIANGPLAGKDLHWLIEHHVNELLGDAP